MTAKPENRVFYCPKEVLDKIPPISEKRLQEARERIAKLRNKNK